MESRLEVHRLRQSGKPQEALLLAERNYEREASVDVLGDYVHLLIQQNFYDRADKVLQSSPFSPAHYQTMYLLYMDLYVCAGRSEDLLRMESYAKQQTGNQEFRYEVPAVACSCLAPDQAYFREQFIVLMTEFERLSPEYAAVGTKLASIANGTHEGDVVECMREVIDDLDDVNLRYFLRAEINLLEGNYRQAEKRYLKLTNRFPRPSLVWNRLGDICLATGRRYEARPYYKKAALLDPDDQDSYRDLIRTHLLSGEHWQARKLYLRAAKRFGDEAIADLKPHLEARNPDIIATVNGLSWYEGGGGVLPIEIDLVAGDGGLRPTGNMGLTMMESLTLAHGYASARARDLGCDTQSADVLVNVPIAPVYKDGPSAGLAFAVGILAKMLNRTVPNGVAFTGEIMMNGDVQGVGGISGKLGAAYYADLELVFVPAMNMADVLSTPNRIKKSVAICPCTNIEEAMATLWPS